jgi:hypothetical protein
VREETHFVICNRPERQRTYSRLDGFRETIRASHALTHPCQQSIISNEDSGPQRSNGSRHEFTKHKPRQRVGMAEPVSREWLALQDLRGLSRDRTAV